MVAAEWAGLKHGERGNGRVESPIGDSTSPPQSATATRNEAGKAPRRPVDASGEIGGEQWTGREGCGITGESLSADSGSIQAGP
jgi:hypothetical protein